MKVHGKAPQTLEEFEKYYQLRWKILRQPWQQPLGSEQDQLENQACHRMLSNDQNHIIAVGRFHKTSQHQAQIRYMAVTNSHQGTGLGGQLLQMLEHEATKQGVKEIVLNAREQAIEFYQAHHYQKLAFSHLLYDNVKHFQMKKTLAKAKDHQTEIAMQLQNIWHNTIPLSKAMNIELCYYDQHRLITTCDQAFNKNLHNTMFAGSIYTLATLTGWGWVYMQLEHAKQPSEQPMLADTVLAEGKIKYLAPITGFAHAETNVDLTSGDISQITQGKKVRFNVSVEIYNGDIIAAIFEGLYVVIPKQKTKDKKPPKTSVYS